MEPRRLDDIPGYNHPEDLKYSRDRVYKTFTEGKKVKKFGTTSIGKNYASYGEYDELCPTCNSPAVVFCQCGHSDKRCKNHHIWYKDRDGQVKLGDPH